jgi:predicted RNA polymerase sigma factor
VSKHIGVHVLLPEEVPIDIDELADLGSDVDSITDAIEDHMAKALSASPGWRYAGGPNTPKVWAERIAARNVRIQSESPTTDD